MQKVPVEDLVENKVLPYNLYDESGSKVLDAGDILTPGKLMQVQQLGDVFKDENETQEAKKSSSKIESSYDDDYDFENSGEDEFHYDDPETPLTIDIIDISNFKSTLNKKAKIDPEMQLKFKAFHIYTLKSIGIKPPAEVAQLYAHLRDKIISDIILRPNNVHYFSELKLMGEYKNCHPLNVAILSGFLSERMGLKEGFMSDIVLGSLLHDIGKTKIPESILDLPTLTDKEQKIIQSHAKTGYKMLKEEFKMSENISKIALEHHEHSNGSGYPYGKSGEFISVESQIVGVCNHFDNLISNKTNTKIHNCRQALKIMLELGSKRFAADALYTFVHMLSYNDIETLEDLAI